MEKNFTPILDERVVNYIVDEIKSLKAAAQSPLFPTEEDKAWCRGGMSALENVLISYGYINKLDEIR